MILLADSGSTKTEWCLAEGGNPVKTAFTKGINPVFESEEEIEKELGYQIGGISPIPTVSNIVVIIDKKVLGKEKIYCGIGVRTKSLELKSSDLVKIVGAKVSDITK